MSDIVNPSTSASSAAQQIVVELIRAGKIGFYDAETTSKEINELYAKLKKGYSEANRA